MPQFFWQILHFLPYFQMVDALLHLLPDISVNVILDMQFLSY